MGKSKPLRWCVGSARKGNEYVQSIGTTQRVCLWHQVGTSIHLFHQKYVVQHMLVLSRFMHCPVSTSALSAVSVRIQSVRLSARQHCSARHMHVSPRLMYASARTMHFSAHNASIHRSLQQPIVFWIQHIVFSRCGIKNPAFDSRIHLLMAGDIESNPGPANGNAGTICRGCSKTIRKSGGKIISIICGTCSSHFHKSHTRIKTREEQDHAEKHPGSWTCYFCCTPSPPPGQIPPPPTGQVPNEV